MKRSITLIRLFLCTVLSSVLLAPSSGTHAQTTHFTGSGSAGPFSIDVTVNEVSLVVPSSCPYGYNYNLQYSYSVTYTGITSNFPSIQVAFSCLGSAQSTIPNGNSSGTLTTTVNPYATTADCATATLANKSCTAYTLFISGDGINTSQTVTATLPTALPITLRTFDAKMQSTGVSIAWTTAVETGLNYMSVERSNDGTTWSALTTIEGKGGIEGGAYAYTDAQPKAGMNYYRLKSSSDDGKAPEYSKTIGVKVFSVASDVHLYPNSGNDSKLHITGLADASQWKLDLSNVAGAHFMSTALSSPDVTLPQLAGGLYFVHLSNPVTGENTTLKYIRD